MLRLITILSRPDSRPTIRMIVIERAIRIANALTTAVKPKNAITYRCGTILENGFRTVQP